MIAKVASYIYTTNVFSAMGKMFDGFREKSMGLL